MKRKPDPAEYRRKWGVPDWHDASCYPANLSDGLWRWEFLRRREDYREDYRQSHAATVTWYRKHSFEEFFQKRQNSQQSDGSTIWSEPWSESPCGDGCIYPDNWENARDSPLFQVQMAGSMEKYGLVTLINPAIARPRELSFFSIYLFNPRIAQGTGKLFPRAPMALALNPYARLDEHIKVLKMGLQMLRKQFMYYAPRKHRRGWSVCLRALDGEIEKLSYAEMCKVLDPHSKRSRNRGEEILDKAHEVQDTLTLPI